MWNRRQTTKFNGASYVIQRGAGGHLHPRRRGPGGRDHRLLPHQRRHDQGGPGRCPGLEVYGADNSHTCGAALPMAPTRGFFNRLLEEANVITTPGAGFGPAGEGYIRLTAFGDAEDTKEAVERIKRMLDAESRD